MSTNNQGTSNEDLQDTFSSEIRIIIIWILCFYGLSVDNLHEI